MTVDEERGLDDLPQGTVISSFEDLLAAQCARDVSELNNYLSARLLDEFAEVAVWPGTFMVHLPSTGGGLGLDYPFTLAAMDELIDELDVMCRESYEE